MIHFAGIDLLLVVVDEFAIRCVLPSLVSEGLQHKA